MVSLEPIGTVKKVSQEEFVLAVLPTYREGLHGVVAGDRLDVLYWMHQLPAEQRRTLKVHPQGNRKKPLRGVFALRSPMRPNPIGVSTVTVRRAEDGLLYVTGFDALDESPILDLKAARRSGV
jgi:tRNA-Thr(GGU) m(6)t(6)A37 methyltransferase TsaA